MSRSTRPPPGDGDVRLALEPPPATLGEVVAMPVEVRADVVRRSPTLVTHDAAEFVGAVRGYRPSSFGDLLDASLALGSGNQQTG